MITVTRLQGEHMVINASMIEFIETTPDTLISLSTGRKLMVRESISEVIDLAVAYYQRIGFRAILAPDRAPATDDNDA